MAGSGNPSEQRGQRRGIGEWQIAASVLADIRRRQTRLGTLAANERNTACERIDHRLGATGKHVRRQEAPAHDIEQGGRIGGGTIRPDEHDLGGSGGAELDGEQRLAHAERPLRKCRRM